MQTGKTVNRGKVRDVYDVGEDRPIATSDRLYAVDVIMNEGISKAG